MDNHLEQARERGDFDDQYPNRESCFCQPLHSGCDPKFCNKAISAPSSEWIEHDEPLEPFKIAGLRTQLGKGAAEGCETCGAILGAGEEISKMYKQGLHHRSDYSERNAVVPARLIAERRPGCLEVREETSITNLVALFKKPGFASSNYCEAIPFSTEVSASTGSHAAFEFCKRRLQSCIETHTACQKQHLYRYPLPSRVIDIGYNDHKLGDGQEDSFHPHLVELGHGQSLEYVTLSHCWGQKQIITTTKNTLLSRLQSVPWEWLSKTFQDAVYITHKLGYRYIWIDSLCIIQDDVLDWETESKKMASIYQNSIFTIAASKSANGDGGCFTSTPDLTGEKLCHPYTNVPTNINWRIPLDHSREPPPRWPGYGANEWDWPLSHRAWTLQEELLSTRVIYYGPYEVLWQCNATLNCQCGEFRRAMPFSHDKGHVNKAEFSAVLNTELRKSTVVVKHQRSLEIQWAAIVEQYLLRQSTRETDRFPALSGLAKQIQAAGLAPLVAGIPANNVLPWLLWESEPSTRRHSVYVAPSWSWASFNGLYTIFFYHPYLTQPSLSGKSEPIAQVVDIVAEPAGLDPTGALKSGRLVLYSFVATVTLRHHIEIFMGQKTGFLRLYMHNPEGSEDRILVPHMDYHEDKQNLDGQELLFVLICRFMTLSPDNPYLVTSGLVLESVEESLYRRVGWCQFPSKDELQKDYKLREVTII